jgi:hypothetical protein
LTSLFGPPILKWDVDILFKEYLGFEPISERTQNMTSEEVKKGGEEADVGHGGHDSHPHHEREVEVTVDRKTKRVKAGEYVVAEFKRIVGVAAERELDILKDGVLVPLKNDEKIRIHGHEVFVSHVPSGGSS